MEGDSAQNPRFPKIRNISQPRAAPVFWAGSLPYNNFPLPGNTLLIPILDRFPATKDAEPMR
jgi:hypothetical protein